ncbi:MAG: hypothetical protein IJU54_00110 [Alphaproteobacteria bacterium]|nr:hypothetical protein [Alphaproteobacteria bacterium]
MNFNKILFCILCITAVNSDLNAMKDNSSPEDNEMLHPLIYRSENKIDDINDCEDEENPLSNIFNCNFFEQNNNSPQNRNVSYDTQDTHNINNLPCNTTNHLNINNSFLLESNNINQICKTTKTDTNNECFNILKLIVNDLTSLNTKVDALIEVSKNNQTKIDDIQAQINKLTNKSNIHNSINNNIENKTKFLGNKLNNIEMKVDVIKQKTNELNGSVIEICDAVYDKSDLGLNIPERLQALYNVATNQRNYQNRYNMSKKWRATGYKKGERNKNFNVMKTNTVQDKDIISEETKNIEEIKTEDVIVQDKLKDVALDKDNIEEESKNIANTNIEDRIVTNKIDELTKEDDGLSKINNK